MQIVRERPCQRRHHRVSAPLKVTLSSGESITATDWSLGGLRLDEVNSPLAKVADEIHLTLELPFQGFDISFEVEAIVMRSTAETGTLGVEFVRLSERARDLLDHFINDLVRGKMATIEDTICRIDVPVTPISTEPDVNPGEEVPIKRWPIKSIVMSTFYLCLGVVVFGYVGILIYTNTMRLEVSSAVISAPLMSLKMPVSGRVIPTNMKTGEMVLEGDVIARVVSDKLELELVSKRIEYVEKERSQALSLEKYELEKGRMQLYQVISQTDEKIALARVNAAKSELNAADNAVARMNSFVGDVISKSKFEEALNRQSAAEAQLQEMEYILERATTMNTVSDRKYFNHKEFVADLDMLALEIESANIALKYVHSQIEQIEQRRDSLVIKAPFNGRIVAAKQVGDALIAQHDVLLTIEKHQMPTVTAFLSQDEILSVGLEDQAKVFLPAIGESVMARVVRIDRSAAFLSSDTSLYTWREGDAKTAAVMLKFDEGLPSGINPSAGLPAVVIFSKRSTSDVYHAIGTMVSSVTKAFGYDDTI